MPHGCLPADCTHVRDDFPVLYTSDVIFETAIVENRGQPLATNVERKEKFGERIVALQQLVSPYGKTDTASVLLEAMDYIRFLHEQIKVLSAPYLQSTPTAKMQELQPYSLRSRGLCLVPVDCTVGVAQSNGADIWAPIKTTSPKFENVTSNFR
nr:basic helix-loop-helix family protein [Rosa persica]